MPDLPVSEDILPPALNPESVSALDVITKAYQLQLRANGRAGNRAYYKPEYGQLYLDTLNRLRDKRIPQRWPLGGAKYNTLRLKVSQARQYALEQMDPTGVYTELDRYVKVSHHERGSAPGVVFSLCSDVTKNAKFAIVDMGDWRRELLEWLPVASDADPKFQRTGMMLTEDDVNFIKSLTNPLREVLLVHIQTTDFTIIYAPEQAAEICKQLGLSS